MSMYALLGRGESPDTIARKIISLLPELGAARMEAGYHGGNDEGGVDEITLFDAEGNTIEFDAWILRPPKEGERTYAQDGMVHEHHPLLELADDMLATEYGTWAGEFEASGTLFADVKENRVWTEGSYMTYVEDAGGSMEVQL